MNKRDFLKTSGIVGLAGILPFSAISLSANGFYNISESLDSDGKYMLPKLPYSYDALEPHIDAETMKLHHSKHHQAYVNGLNNATEKIKEATSKGDFTLIKHWEKELAFHGAGHFLHCIFWKIMGPKQGNISIELQSYINKSFGSTDNFLKLFKASASSVEGSGWGMLSYEPVADKLIVTQVEKHSNLSQWITIPIIVVDVWEHAYYLRYQNKRADYLEAFTKVINWDFVSDQFSKILKTQK